MTSRVKEIIKIVLIIILFINIVWACFHFMMGILLVPRMPDEDLKNALKFVSDRKSIGMTLDECEAIFGDCGRDSPGQVVAYPVGSYKWMSDKEYTLYIYFDESERVKKAILEQDKEW